MELEELLEQDLYQTHEELALTVDIIQNTENWILYELKPLKDDFAHMRFCFPRENALYSHWLLIINGSITITQ